MKFRVTGTYSDASQESVYSKFFLKQLRPRQDPNQESSDLWSDTLSVWPRGPNKGRPCPLITFVLTMCYYGITFRRSLKRNLKASSVFAPKFNNVHNLLHAQASTEQEMISVQ